MPAACDLGRIYGDLAQRVPDGPPQPDCIIFHAGNLPEPPASHATDAIVIRKATHDYGGWYRADSLWMYLAPPTCRKLGLFLLAAGFHGPKTDTVLELTHPESDIRRIVVRGSELRLEDPPVGLTMKPFALRYYPAETRKHPWLYPRHEVHELPVLGLSNATDCVGASDEDWKGRDTVWMSAFDGMFLLAELLLNAGCSWNPVREYQLEGDAGFRGVGRMSAELRIFLPGSDGWLFEDNGELSAGEPL